MPGFGQSNGFNDTTAFNLATGFNYSTGFSNGGAPAFNPLSNPNLQLWAETTSGVTNSSGNASQILNQAATGTTYDLIQRTGDSSTNLPAYTASGGQRNKPFITFNGSSSRMAVRNALSFTGDFDIFCLASPKRKSNTTQPVLFGNGGGGSSIQFTNFKALKISTDSASATWDGTTTQQIGTLDDGLHLFRLCRTGSTVKYYADKMLVATATLTGTFTLDTLGWSLGAAFMCGDIYLIAAYNAYQGATETDTFPATLTQAGKVEDYICNKYDHAQHLILFGTESTTNCTIAAGADSADGIAGQLLSTLRTNGYTNYVFYVEAVVGSTLAQAETRAAVNGTMVGIDQRNYRFREKPMYYAWSAGNDLGGSNTTVMSRYTSYLTNRTNTGKYGRMFGDTIYIAMGAANDTNAAIGGPLITSWNTYLKANQPATLTAIGDVGAQPHLNSGGNSTLGTGIYDGTYYNIVENPILHLVKAGNTIVTAVKYSAISAYLTLDALAS